ncbi:UPF0370 protein YpfN [Candidatus Erwinia haradaeae]|uniref:UPF0370 protein YpfN, partial n=1 Tax=Candidatus Erwinia haradaeae TaxID=1922217 RepID=A0A451DJP6_9GAMM|nr:hypothetical protein [Candidatus Erwinia haradaeae]VFP86867.1 UPF0370 protein YpfN [Candidatus Erwinia haradaeae]
MKLIKQYGWLVGILFIIGTLFTTYKDLNRINPKKIPKELDLATYRS